MFYYPFVYCVLGNHVLLSFCVLCIGKSCFIILLCIVYWEIMFYYPFVYCVFGNWHESVQKYKHRSTKNWINQYGLLNQIKIWKSFMPRSWIMFVLCENEMEKIMILTVCVMQSALYNRYFVVECSWKFNILKDVDMWKSKYFRRCLKYSLTLNGKYRSHLRIAWNLQNPILLRSNVTSYLWIYNSVLGN